MDKVELKSVKDNDAVSKSIKYLSIDKTRIPLTDDEYNFMRQKINEHIEKHGITYGFVFNLFLKEDENGEEVEE